MRRTIQWQRSMAAGCSRGQVIVVTSFTDPERGLVRCDAAPLVATWLAEDFARAGIHTEVRIGSGIFGLQSDGMMISVSYEDRGGSISGLAVLARHDDAPRLRVIEEALQRWSALLQSRRILVADQELLCWGGVRALDMIKRAALDRERVFVVGNPVADFGVLRIMSECGVKFVAHLDAVPDGARVVFPAQGACMQTRVEAKARGLDLVDGTCPLVAAAHSDALAYAERGDTVLVIGREEDAAFPILETFAGDLSVVLRDVEDLERLNLGIEKPSFVIDPGMALEEALKVVAALKRRFPDLAGHHFEALCEVASQRNETLRSVAAASDLMLILSGQQGSRMDGAEAASLLQVVRDVGTTVRVIEDGTDLRPCELEDATCIGLAVTLSAPASLRHQIITELSGLGPLTVRHRKVSTFSASPRVKDY